MILIRLAFLALLVTLVAGCGAPMWPTTSHQPVPVLEHPDFDATLEREGVTADTGLRLAVIGDQRALGDGEFQALIRAIAQREANADGLPPLVGVLDTGDIVDNGKHTDQFRMLTDILQPVARWPYLVAVGNHELDNDLSSDGAIHYAEFMGSAPGEFFDRKRLWYRKDAPGLRILFLDSNQWVYGPNEDQSTTRTEQLAWLSAQLSEEYDGRTVVLMHHPILISSKKHLGEAQRMWKVQWGNRLLVEIFAEGGVDLLLVGHTHTYERFRLTAKEGGQSFQLANISGRPRNAFLGFGAGARRAQDIQGREEEYLSRVGWTRSELEQYKIEQLEAMSDPDTEANQWAELTLLPDGSLAMEIFYLVDGGEGGYRAGGRFPID